MQPDIYITNKDGEIFSVKANQGKFTIDIDYYGTKFHGDRCIVASISPGKVNGRDTIKIEILPDYTSISKGEVNECKLESNIEEEIIDNNCN